MVSFFLYFLKMSFHLIYEISSAKNQKIFKGGRIRNNEETEYFEQRTLFLKKAYLPKWEGAKYAGGSPRSCYKFSQNPTSEKCRSLTITETETWTAYWTRIKLTIRCHYVIKINSTLCQFYIIVLSGWQKKILYKKKNNFRELLSFK